MSIEATEQHGRDTSVPIKHIQGVGDMYRCRCGRDVVAGNPCDGIMGGKTVPPLNRPDPRAGEVMLRLGRHLRENGSVVITWSNGEFVIGSEWGKEAEDSPMAGAAAYGVHPNLVTALDEMLQDSLH